MDLDKALRAMQHAEAWTNSVQAACLFEGVEYTPQLLAAMTKAHLDDLVMDTETLEIQVPKTVGEPLLAAVAAYQPPAPEPAVTPELERRISTLEARLEQVDTLSEDMSDLRSALDLPDLTPKPGLGTLN